MQSPFVLLQRVLPKRLVSDIVGWLARIRGGWLTQLAIRLFVRAYGVDLTEAKFPEAGHYATFNEFFTRALSLGQRPQPADPHLVSCPADGRVSEQGDINHDTLLQAKGMPYSLCDLFDGDTTLSQRFNGGSFQTIYLAPHNYHRVHIPIAGRARYLRYVPGALYSVNGATTRALPRLFCRNERVAVAFESDYGWYALIMVGALNVGSIDLTLPKPIFSNRPRPTLVAGTTHEVTNMAFARGDEFGRFNMGSTVIFLASPGMLEWHADCAADAPVRVGQAIASMRA